MGRIRRPWPDARRRIGRLGLLLTVVAGLLVLGPLPSAQAHAFLLSSNPSDGAMLPAAPSQLRLRFSETVVVEVTRIEVVAADGHTVEPANLRLAGTSADPEDPVELVGDLPALPTGAFRVSWQTLSRDDLHRTAGVFVFGIGSQVRAAGVAEPGPQLAESALRWVLFLALAAALGGGLVARLFRRAGAIVTAGQAESLAADGALTGVLASWVLLLEQAHSSGLRPTRLLSGSYGWHWTIREAGLLLLVGGCYLARRHPSGTARALLTSAGGLLAAVGAAELGHARSAGPTAVLADSAHLLAAALWSGTLVVLVILGYRGLRAGGEPAAAVRRALRGFGGPAAGCLGVVVVTGVYLSSTVVGSVDAALLTRYGRLLLLKVALVGVIAVLGLINHRRIRRVGRLRLAVPLADATAAVLVLGLAALLTSSQPAREPQFVRAPNLATVPVADAPVADLQQALTVRPNLPGHNVALAEVFDTRRPAPAPITGVWFTATEVDGRTVGPVAGQRLPDGQWSAPLDLVSAGRGHITITVRRTGLADAVGRFSWVIGDAGRSVRPVTVSDAPIGAALGWLAAGLLVLFAAAAVVALVRGRSSQAPRPGSIRPEPGAPTRGQQQSAASSAAERIGVG